VIRADYFVITALKTRHLDAHYPSIVGQYVSNPKDASLLGYFGFRGDNGVFAGENGQRYLFWASGNEAHYMATTLKTENWEGISVARIDLQITITCLDADYLIEHIQPNKSYKSTLIVNLNDKGSTLYVGSPTSRIRLRIYNKTAQSGLQPDEGGEYIRFELQCRDSYADKAYTALRNNMARAFFTMYVKKMLDTYTTNIVQSSLASFNEELFVGDFRENKEDRLLRKKRWIEQTVLPSLRRMLVEDKDYVDKIIDRLYNDGEQENGSDKY